MKKSKFIQKKMALFFSVLFIAFLLVPKTSTAQVNVNVNIGINDFYQELSPYGQWVQNPEYGTVWVPRVDNQFRPYYTNGYWVNTEYGNTWVSNYRWGWATFHYGRWGYSQYYGWFWVPGSEWGPAWVTWRQGGGYYGWAPIRPGVSINIALGNSYHVPNNYWSFIPYNNLYAHNLYHHHHSYNTTIFNNTTIIQNTYANNNRRYVAGPSRRDYKRHTGRRVRTYEVNSSSRPGRSQVSKDRVSIYRPSTNRRASSRRDIKATTPRNRVNTSRQQSIRKQPNIHPRRTVTPQRNTTKTRVRRTATKAKASRNAAQNRRPAVSPRRQNTKSRSNAVRRATPRATPQPKVKRATHNVRSTPKRTQVKRSNSQTTRHSNSTSNRGSRRR